jgi:SAM-dependent MidA family methyltransferase
MPSDAQHSNLPALTEEQVAHTAKVLEAVRAAALADGGWLTFDRYLQLVMYAPGLGYYSAGSTKFGAAGDFITARQCAPLLQQLGSAADILELGAGSGRLAVDVLTRLESLDALPARYWILEVSADLRARQRALVATLPAALRERVHWLESLPAVTLSAVVLANEVWDALPFKRFVIDTTGVQELGVALAADGTLLLRAQPADAATLIDYQRIAADLPQPLRAGYTSELCPLLDGWMAGLAGTLAAGAMLLFDYGVGRREYYHPERGNGTLRCHYRHRAHDDALLHPGLQDITAWVDFTRVAEAASAAGMEVSGYCTQAAFLLGAGINKELAAATGASESGNLQRARRATEARQLLMPGEMGESFKAMALTKNCDLQLHAFSVQDLRRQL